MSCGECEYYKYSKYEKDFICINPRSERVYDVVSYGWSCKVEMQKERLKEEVKK